MESVIHERIRKQINNDDVVLYMKGTAIFPLSGPSASVVQILSQMGVHFKDINLSEDSLLRAGVLEFTDWPILPLLYVKGHFIGGADIVREMFETGELEELFVSNNIECNVTE